MLRIVHVAPTDLALGGAERYAFELAKAMSEFAVVTLITFAGKKETLKVSDRFTVKRYPALTLPVTYFSATNPLPLSLDFFKDISNADVVHIHGLRTVVCCWAIFFSRLKKRILCLTDHGGGAFKIASWIPFFGRSIDLCLTQSLMKSSTIYKKLIDVYHKEYRNVGGGIDPQIFYPRTNAKENKILFTGRVLPHKGVDILVSAVQDLNTELRIVTLAVDSLYLREMVVLDKNKRISLKFKLSDEELAKEYSSALVTVLPSLYTDLHGRKYADPELLGLVLIESMACGTPVICTDVGGMPGVVEEGVTGFVVPPANPEALREKIRYFLENPKESIRMGLNGRQGVLDNYAWKAVAERCITSYGYALKKSSKGATV